MLKDNGLDIITTVDGKKSYYKNKILHREDGPAVEFRNGNKHWYFNGLLHRVDGPAIDNHDGFKAWYKNGALHRLDGPALETIASWEREWWIDGKRICRGNDAAFKRLINLKLLW